MDAEAAQLTNLIRQELCKLDRNLIGDVQLTPHGLVALDSKLKIAPVLVREQGAQPAMAHAHIVSEIGLGPTAILEACVVGIHPEREVALTQLAQNWVMLAAAPILSLLHCRPVLGAHHFVGSEAWGVPGYHGFVGPMAVRFDDDSFDPNALSEAPLFSDTADLTPAGMVHLVKATLQAVDGRWQRTLEVDGHAASRTDENWPLNVPVPKNPLLCIRFAVCFADRAKHAARESRGLFGWLRSSFRR